MEYSYSVRSERFVFSDLRELLARANEPKAGDRLAGIAARSERERVAAKFALADVPLSQFLDHPVLDPSADDVSRLIHDGHDREGFAPLRSMTVGEFREWLLDHRTDGAILARLHWAVTPEIAAAVTKLMANKELVYIAAKIRVITRCRNTLGGPNVFGVRIQPNHPTDDLGGILLSAVDGLQFGCGDAVIGVNPAADSVDTVVNILQGLDRLIEVLGAPTQHCCLAHVTTQLAALDRGAPVDLLFQSVAGTQAANASFGVTLAMLGEARERVLESHRGRNVSWAGDQFTYFETGQGSALSANAHQGVDQLTLEARAQAVARAFDPFLVNSVVGFIGPEYLADEREIVRAGLEDHFVGKLLGLPMGVDVCYTNHADADAAGVNYVMGVPCADDVMLNYQSTSYHDAAMIRELFGRRPAPEFAAWLEERGIFQSGRLAETSDRRALLGQIMAMLPD